MSNPPLWTPSAERVAHANITRFAQGVMPQAGRDLSGYDALWQWSIEDIEPFWRAMWDFGGVIASTGPTRTLADAERMPGARFFDDAKLNFAQNLLARRPADDPGELRVENRRRRP